MNVRIVLLFVIVCLGIAPYAMAGEKPLTNPDVIELAKLGLGDSVVIAKIRQAPAVQFDLETNDLAALKKAGVSGAAIAAMLERATVNALPRQGTANAGGTSGPEPEFIGTFFHLDQATGTLTPLERQTATASMEIRGLGFGGAYSTAITLTGDWLPDRWRSVGVPTISVGTPAGGTVVGALAPTMIE